MGETALDALVQGLQPEVRALLRVTLAMALGGVLGVERQSVGKAAGLRTHMLIAGTAALLVVLADGVAERFARASAEMRLQVDPLRVIEAIVAGVGFVGAGTIIRRAPDDVSGLTTAASLLMTAAIGMSVAVGQIVTAAGVTALVLLTLTAMRALEPRPR